MAVPMAYRKADLIGGGLALVVFLATVLAMNAVHRAHLASTADANKPVVNVGQHDRQFDPSTLTITRGTIVHITNRDRFTHHVYVKSPTMNFDSGEEPIGTSVNLEFDNPGTFHVLCAIHPTMDLVVTVK